MKIGIIGGGISGVYSAHLLSKNHDVTIFEDQHWGGDIQHETVKDKCYPVSTQFAMPNDDLLIGELKNVNAKLRVMKYPPIYSLMMVFMLVGLTSINFFNSVGLSKYMYAITTVLILLFTIIYAIKSVCYLTLTFGAEKKCKWYSLFEQASADFLLDSIKFVENCGFSRLVNFYRSNPKVNFMYSKVQRVEYEKSKIMVRANNNDFFFDKIIVACPYNSYSSFMDLDSRESKILSNVTYFDFYSTLVNFGNNKKPKNIDGMLGFFQQDSDTYIIASHKPLGIKQPTLFIKQHKWRMPSATDNTEKKLINLLPNRNTYFIGKEIAGSGINYCMEYAKKITQIINCEGNLL
jgi:hypothetical protein